MENFNKLSGSFTYAVSVIAGLPWVLPYLQAYIQHDTEIVRLQTLLNLSRDDAVAMHQRMRNYANDVWDAAWDRAEWMMSYGVWDETLWRSYVDRFLLR